MMEKGEGQNTDTQATTGNNNNSVEDVEGRVNDLTNQLEEEQGKTKDLKTQLASEQGKTKDLETQLASEQGRRDVYTKQLSDLIDRLTGEESMNKVLKGELADKKTQNKRLKTQLAEEQGKSKALKDKLAEEQQTRNNLSTQFKTNQKSLEEGEGHIKALRSGYEPGKVDILLQALALAGVGGINAAYSFSGDGLTYEPSGQSSPNKKSISTYIGITLAVVFSTAVSIYQQYRSENTLRGLEGPGALPELKSSPGRRKKGIIGSNALSVIANTLFLAMGTFTAEQRYNKPLAYGLGILGLVALVLAIVVWLVAYWPLLKSKRS
jgi:hypothetical protein